VRDRREVGEPARLQRLERGSRGNGFGAETSRRLNDSRASAGNASFVTSSAKLARVMPKIPPRCCATVNASSSAAARVAPTMSAVRSGASDARKRAAAAIRSCDEGDEMNCSM
jgi:hypothetical protein